MPRRSTRRSRSEAGSEGRHRIAALVAGVPVLLSGVSGERAAIICLAIYSVVYLITATSLVEASYRSPPIDVTPFAGSRLGPLSDPLGTDRRTHERFFGSLCGPHGRVASRTAKRPIGPPRPLP